MKILIVGAGPAGLYLAYLLKRQDAKHQVRIVEQNPPDATFGFGVVFSDRALDFLRDDDVATHALIVPAMRRWTDLNLVHRGQRITIDGVGFAAIGRLALLRLLQQRLAAVGMTPEYGHLLSDAQALQGFDLVVAADGANSFVRRVHQSGFGTDIEPLANRFVWYGTSQPFDTLTQTFIRTEHGCMNAHHYPYAQGMSAHGRSQALIPEGDQRGACLMSTFIVECDPGTWQRAGFAQMGEDQTRATLEQAFAEPLGGRPLAANKSLWRQFPKIRNARWSTGNCVLVGDALRTAHFSIGSGTRLAFEDVIALAEALREQARDLPAALQAYEAARRPIVETLVDAANRSADWYEHFAEHMQLEPWALAWSYIQRSGRVDIDKLRQVSPRFVAGYEDWRRR
jgi:2-polyprenyl-6-methoxyphenol hydroxylase-like FAD-dependent oxidoreductase